MKKEETEILVIGAGPAGLIAAREAALREIKVTVLEEDIEIGLPCHCAGLLSLEGLAKIGVASHESFIQNKLKGARFFSPSELSFTVERSEAVACVVDRSLLDKFLAYQAIKASAQINLNSKVLSVERTRTGLLTYGEYGSAKAEILIDAEGVSSRIMRAVGLKPLNLSNNLTGLQYDINDVAIDPDYVEVHISRRVAPNFFSWVIPLSEDSARVGLACKGGNPKEYLDQFIFTRFKDIRRLERIVRSGQVVICGPIVRTYADNLLVVGDAAGQVKPTTGGGVIWGGICASIAGQVAAKAVKRSDFSSNFLKLYERLWKEKLGKEFNTTLLARRLMNRLSDKAVDKLFKIIIDENLQDQISAAGDMDFQSKIILKLLKKKEVFQILPSFLKALSPFSGDT